MKINQNNFHQARSSLAPVLDPCLADDEGGLSPGLVVGGVGLALQELVLSPTTNDHAQPSFTSSPKLVQAFRAAPRMSVYRG